MNKLILTLNFLFSLLLSAQTDWELIHEDKENIVSNNIQFVNKTIGWGTFNDYPGLYKTVDGGLSWKIKFEYGSNHYELGRFHYCFVNENIGYLTLRDTVFKTTDGGNIWLKLSLYDNYNGDSHIPKFANENYGIIISYGYGGWWGTYQYNTFSLTVDGGESWQKRDTPVVPKENVSEFWGYSITSDSLIWIWTEYNLFRSIATDTSWLNLTSNLPSVNWEDFYSNFQFIDKNVGYLILHEKTEEDDIEIGNLYKTEDGGESWQNLGEYPFLDYYGGWYEREYNSTYLKIFKDDSGIFANGSWIRKTIDGGNNFEVISSHSNVDVQTLCFIDINNGFGLDFDRNLRKTTNGGATWEYVNGSVLGDIQNARFLGSGVGYVNSGNGTYKTKNGGLIWTPLHESVFNDESELGYVEFLNENIGFGLGKNLDPINPSIGFHKTIDGGMTWKFLSEIENSYFSRKKFIFQVNESHIWLAWSGYDGVDHIKFTTDGGLTWGETKIEGRLLDMYFINAIKGWYTTGNDGLFYTNDGGQTWNKESIRLEREEGLKIDFLDENFGYIYGDWVISITNSGGNTWQNINWKVDQYISSLKFLTEEVAYVIYRNDILRTNNGGNTWEIVFSDKNLYWGSSIECSPDGILWVVSKNGIVFRNINPLTSIDKFEHVPNNFALNQNYPNPFNPSTVIGYTLPPPSADGVKSEKAKVKLILFDILGREVVILVNEKQKPGIYEITWDAGNYPSGVYFYRLQTGEFSETKKMILLR